MKSSPVTTSEGFTSFRGYVRATMRELHTAFGEPTFFYPGDKVTVEWRVRFENGTFATIYDYKRYDDGVPDMDEVYEYHVGGANDNSLILVLDAVMKVQG